MDRVGDRQRLIGMTQQELIALATSLGMPSFTGRQIAIWLYQKGASDIAQMTDLSKDNRRRLAERYTVGIMPPTRALRSEDGTVKYLFPTAQGHSVETVYIPDGERATLCVSSQVGCKMACTFCATGRQGFEGNLSAGDILNQVYAMPLWRQLTNIVFMGQGEPMDNLDSVLRATELLQADYSLAWSPKRLTVSTVGIRGKLTRFLAESRCHLAVSMHAADHELRAQLLPAEKGMPIKDIVEELRKCDFAHQRRLTFEYVMLAGVNDSARHAQAIVSLLKPLPCRVNLIPLHESAASALRCSAPETIDNMCRYLTAHGITTTIRTSRGKDIAAACGQLTTSNKINDNGR